MNAPSNHSVTIGTRTSDLAGHVAFVAGGYGGIGEAVCWSLARAGAIAIVAGRKADRGAALSARLRDSGFDSDFAELDADDPSSIGKKAAAKPS